MESPARLAIRGLKKSFGPNRVLRDLSLTLAAGEIHALIGGNGAGKSTLSKIIAGLERRDAGEITLDGARFDPANRRAAQAAGVVMVLQELTVLPTLTVAENLFLGALPTRLGRIDRTALRTRAHTALARVGLAELEPDTPAAALGVGHQQLVEIAGGLAQQCRLLILDEPTAALTGAEVETLFRLLRDLRAGGTTILYISHRLDEIAALADRVSVLRDGQLTATLPAKTTPRAELIRHMAGEAALAAVRAPHAPVAGEVALRVSQLSAAGLVHDVSFAVRRGEIVGLGGLIGAGRTELLRALFGAEPVEHGAIFLGAERRPFVPRDTATAVAAGFAFVPEDRKHHGIFAPLSVRANASAANLPRRAALPGWVDGAAEARDADALLAELQVRHAGPHQPIAELSGGNQQKIVIGRWLRRDVAVWLLDEPTRGVDVPARDAIHALLRARAAAGAAVLVASSDYEELAALCDRVLVMSRGTIAAEFERSALTPAAFMAAAFSGFATPTPG